MVPALTASAAKTLGVSIVSWRSWETLEMTLSSYQEVGLFDFFDRLLLYFQDLGQRDIEIAAKFGLPYGGGPNCGIADGMRNAATELGTDYVLFLENDCPLIETRDEVEFQLKTARQYLESGIIDVMRLRSRLHPGEAFADVQKYLRYYPVRKKEPLVDIRPYRLEIMFRWLWRVKRYNLSRMKGRAIYVEQAAEELFPEVIQKTAEGFWILDSCCADWTNQSALCRRDFFTDVLMPYVDAHPSSRTSNGFQSPERPLNCRWWRNQHFKIGQGKGLFTHRRVDGSWREEHPAFEGEKGSDGT
jgi:hypothetical protein